MSDIVDDQPFGEWLKEQRSQKNISLEEIAAVTKVHIAQLKMIEEDKWAQLPASAFVRGFLICYATHVGINEEEVLRRYKLVMGKNLRTIESALPAGYKGVHSASKPKVRVASTPNFQKAPGANQVNFTETPLMTPKRMGIIGVVIFLLIFLVVLISLGKKKETTEPETVPVEQTQSTEAVGPEAPAEVDASNVEANAPAPAPKHTLELIGVEESWVIVKNGDAASNGFSLKPKERRSFDISPRAQLVLSNAGALEIKWNGVLYESPGFRGDVKRLKLPDQLDTLKEKKYVAPRKVIEPRSTPAVAPIEPPAAPTLPGALPGSLPGQAPAPQLGLPGAPPAAAQ